MAIIESRTVRVSPCRTDGGVSDRVHVSARHGRPERDNQGSGARPPCEWAPVHRHRAPLNSAGKFESRTLDTPFVIRGSYFEDRRYSDTVERDGLRMTFTSRHRPLQSYFDALETGGMTVERLVEVPDSGSTGDRWQRLPCSSTFGRGGYRGSSGRAACDVFRSSKPLMHASVSLFTSNLTATPPLPPPLPEFRAPVE